MASSLASVFDLRRTPWVLEHGQNRCWKLSGTISSWWLNQPTWKICSSKWIISLVRDENKKYLKPPPRFVDSYHSMVAIKIAYLCSFLHEVPRTDPLWPETRDQQVVMKTTSPIFMTVRMIQGSFVIQKSYKIWRVWKTSVYLRKL